MSIINDALKKAQAQSGEKPSSPTARNLEVRLERRRESRNWGPLFVVLVLLLVTGPLLAPVLSVPFRSFNSQISTREVAVGPAVPVETPVEVASAQNPTRKAQFGIEEVRLAGVPALYPRPNLHVSGIMYTTPEDSYALVNGEILKVGQTVNGARLVRVTPTEITVDFQGEKLVVPVSS